MAQDKKSIIVYADWLPQFEQLSDEEAGKLIKHFFRYVNDLNPEPPDRLIQIAFEPLKQSLKRDLKKWEKVIEKRSQAGKASVEARKKAKKKDEQNSTNSTHVKSVQHNPTNSTVNDNVNVNDNVSVSVSVNDISTKVDKDNNEIKNFVINNNLQFSENLKFHSQSWIESVAMQQKISIDEIQKKIDEFVLFLKTTEKNHNSKKEFISHFINWIPKKIESDGREKKSSSTSAKKQFRFSTDEAIEAITSGS